MRLLFLTRINLHKCYFADRFKVAFLFSNSSIPVFLKNIRSLPCNLSSQFPVPIFSIEPGTGNWEPRTQIPSMKKFLIFPILLFSIALFAQPTNDDCNGILDLGVAPFCSDNFIYFNVDATQSDIGNDNFPDCWTGDPERDVWFSFTATDTILEYTISVIGCPHPLGYAPITNPQIAIYRGDICAVDELVLLDCAPEVPDPGVNQVDLNPPALTPGITYYLRINDWSSNAIPNSGGFKLCIKEQEKKFTIDQDGSTACSGQVCDTGGEDGDYGNNEDHVFTICPDQPHNCINMSMEFFNIENFNDVLIFYDGPDINSPVIASLDGSGFGLASNGGVCFQAFASSGCLTIQFQSDAATTFEGFNIFWECTAQPCDFPDPIQVNTDIDNQTIVDNIATDQTIVTIDTIICGGGAIGTFTADGSDLGLDKGLLITSGDANGAANPGAFFTSVDNGNLGDLELDYLSGVGNPSFNACVIELDVFVATDELTFEYVFGSEEYPEFVNSNFNDIFAFLVSGPGIMGDPNIANQLNIATLPDGNNTPITINSVNSSQNWEYYRNNENGLSVAYDGLTSDFMGIKKSLTARVGVEPCNTYHLKIAVGDRTDQVFDSGVFLSEIKGGTPTLEVNYFSGIDYLVEECTLVPDELVISLGEAKDDTTTYTLVVSGTATVDEDYSANFPATVTFLPGENSISIPIQALPDGIDEGIETIELALTNDFGCGIVSLAELTIEIHDNLAVEIFAGADTAFVCEGGAITMDVEGALNYFWTPPIVFDDPNIADPVATPDVSQWVQVVGTLGVCSDMDSVWLEVTAPVIEIEALGPTELCEGESVTLVAVNNVGNESIMWTPTLGLDDPTSPTVVASPGPGVTTYSASVSLNGCGANATIDVTVDDFDFPELTTTDTTICQNYSVTLAEALPNSTTTFEWSPPNSLDDPNISNATGTPNFSVTYTLIATSASGICADTAEVNVEVLPADVDILTADTIEICVGESVLISTETTTDGVGLSWTPQDSLSIVTVESVVVDPTETTWYYAWLQTANCLVVDSVLVIVDSLPDLSIMAVPDQETYCEGEQITLVSETYEPAYYPNVEHQWNFGPGVQTPDSFLNMVLLATDTFTYVRETNNRGCSSLDSIEIIVIPVTSMEIIPADTTVCPGESVQFQVIANPDVTGVTWEGQGLSCNDCFDPIATPPNSGTFNYSVEGEFEGCPIGASATIFAQLAPAINFPNPPAICSGESITLNLTPDPTATFEWTLSDGTFLSNEPAPEVSPTSTTTYNVFASNGCETDASVTIEVFEDPLFQFPDDLSICQGEEILLNSISSPGANYTWTSDQGYSSNNSQPTDTPLTTSTYTMVASNPGCQVSGMFTVEVIEAPMVNVPGDVTICQGESVTLNTIDTPGANYQWTASDGSLNFNGAIPPDVSPSMTTTYFVTADLGDCSISEEITVTVIEPFDVFISPLDTLICLGDTIALEATIDGAFDVEFIWSVGGEVVGIGNVLNGLSPGDLTTYMVLAQDTFGCESAMSASTITVLSGLSIDSFQIFQDGELLTDTTNLYEGEVIDITVFTTPSHDQLSNPTYEWFFNTGFLRLTQTNSTGEIILPEVDGNLTVPFGVDISYDNSCPLDPLFDNLTILDDPVRIPNAFTPDNDGMNDFFTIVFPDDLTPIVEDFKVFNRWGQMVYDNENGLDGWNGMQDGKPAQSDVYVFYIVYRISEVSRRITLKGDVTLLR